jgi:two-component system sensor kinase FixL
MYLESNSRIFERMTLGRLPVSARVTLAVLLTVVVAVIDWRVDAPYAFAFLYLFPILLIGTVGERWHVVLTALACTALADVFDPFPFDLLAALPQDILIFTSLAGTGLFGYEVTRSRRQQAENLRRVEAEAAARRAAEEQLEFLIGSSPVAILIMGSDCCVLRANQAAHRLLRVPDNGLPGRTIQPYLPALSRVPFLGETRQTFRTEMQCRGRKEGGDVFLADVFFSTYQTAMGPRLAALVVDASEGLREREESGLEQLMDGSRILVGAVSHEVRNVCGAIGVIYENMARQQGLKSSKDFEALGSLVEALNKIASMELKQSKEMAIAGATELFEVFDELRIVLEPRCADAGIELRWQVPDELPPVWADRHRLLQVLLNLTKNSERALGNAPMKRIEITVEARASIVSVRVCDTGPGIAAADKLFQPFQKGADSTGLGLYLSRAFVRSFHGELRHDPSVSGCCFTIELAVAGTPSGPGETVYGHTAKDATHSTVIAG